MFEYHLHGLEYRDGFYTHTATTHDFLQVCADVVRHYNIDVLGAFVSALFNEHNDKLDFIRIGDWNFAYAWAESRNRDGIAEGTNVPVEKRIELRKVA